MTIYSLDVLLFLFGTVCSMSISNFCFLTCIQVSQEEGQVVWYSHLFQNFLQLIVIRIVSKAEIDVFLELSCFFDSGPVLTLSNAAHTSLFNPPCWWRMPASGLILHWELQLGT